MGLKIRAYVRVDRLENLGWDSAFIGISSKFRGELVAGDLHHVFSVSKGRFVKRGEEGEVTFEMFSDAILNQNIAIGDKLEINYGSIRIGDAIVRDIIKY